jgi:predicted transcriptional regulator
LWVCPLAQPKREAADWRGLSLMPHSDTLQKAAQVIAAFVANNSVRTNELPALIQKVHASLARLSGAVENPAPKEDTKGPAVSIRKSITPDYLICLEDGKKLKFLRRHLERLGLTPEQYRAKWKLPSDYPMVAPNYAAKRSAIAKAAGFGLTAVKAQALRPTER